MSDLSDFIAAHPTPDPPPGRVDHAAAAKVKTAGSMRLVDNTVCRVGCTDHNHTSPIFIPQPDLDEALVGWTPQHIPRDPNRHVVPKRCVLCWVQCDDLSEHACSVMEVLGG